MNIFNALIYAQSSFFLTSIAQNLHIVTTLEFNKNIIIYICTSIDMKFIIFCTAIPQEGIIEM